MESRECIVCAAPVVSHGTCTGGFTFARTLNSQETNLGSERWRKSAASLPAAAQPWRPAVATPAAGGQAWKTESLVGSVVPREYREMVNNDVEVGDLSDAIS